MKVSVNDTVLTPDGVGIVKGFEGTPQTATWRILVELEEHTYCFSPAAYQPHEILKEGKKYNEVKHENI
ncbi:MAG: hypothetical protein HQL29_05140 [Candidatus Omnitrophica bacterium]|nr:hypothetical protein [Candidatus Omnitrophota bacterium]